MTEAEPPLRRLARLAGIDTRFIGAFGQEHAVPDDVIRRLAAALGYPADSDADLAAALARLEDAPWLCLAPPVLLARDGDATRPMPLHLPAGAGRVAWTLVLEDGTARTGAADADSLPCDARHAVAGRAIERRLLDLPALPDGYHRLHLAAGAVRAETLLIAAPARCHLPAGTRMHRGVSTQLYSLRSARNWGIGDFTDLGDLAEALAGRGVDAIGINPLHALFGAEPGKVSPYSPSSRRFLNPIYLDVEAVADFAECAEAQALVDGADFQARLARLRDAALIDHAGVAAAKRAALELLFANFRARHIAAGTPRARAFADFRTEAGADLEAFALYEALSEHVAAGRCHLTPWSQWPEAWRDPDSAETRRFAAAAAEPIAFHAYLQWQAELQLAAAARRCRAAGLAIGLYGDLALGVDGAGGEAWADQGLYATGASVGAPPDAFNQLGQAWGLPPLRPDALRARFYAPFIALLRANMRHFGALRIDHVLGLRRLYWIPAGGDARGGGYVAYPTDEMIAILKLESTRQGCVVVGEDLGTVPPDLVGTLRDAGILSYRLLYFERAPDGGFASPDAYPPLALVGIGTHDLPTLAGWWSGADIALRHNLGLFPDDAARDASVAERARDRARLVARLHATGLLPAGFPTGAGLAPAERAALLDAAHAFLARTPCRLGMAQAEDLLGVADQVNLPGTVDQHPNWRRKLPADVAQLAASPRLAALTVGPPAQPA